MPQAKKPSNALKLINFDYECTNSHGVKIKGEVSAASMTLAKAELLRQGLKPITVTKHKTSFLSKLKGKKKITTLDICYFSRQMSTMMTAGIPLVQSFEIVAKGVEKESVRELILGIKSEVEGGRSFSESLTIYPKYFDPLFCNLVAAGEASGALETMLDRVATYKEKTETLKKKIKKALTYPIAVLVMAVVVSGVMLVYVVPTFENLFKGFGADLPAFTRMVIDLSKFMQKWWYVIAGTIVGTIVFLAQSIKTNPKVRHFFQRLLLQIPVIGGILHKAAVARFTRTLSTTFAAGVPLVEALDSVAAAAGNIVYSSAILKIKDDVSTGSQLQLAMRNTGVFPNMVVQMVLIGEESGALDKMLSKVASIYEEEVDSAVDGLTALLEPMIMSVLAVLVGSLVVAMYLPIFKMGSVV